MRRPTGSVSIGESRALLSHGVFRKLPLASQPQGQFHSFSVGPPIFRLLSLTSHRRTPTLNLQILHKQFRKRQPLYGGRLNTSGRLQGDRPTEYEQPLVQTVGAGSSVWYEWRKMPPVHTPRSHRIGGRRGSRGFESRPVHH